MPFSLSQSLAQAIIINIRNIAPSVLSNIPKECPKILYGEQVRRARENLAGARLEGFVHLKQANLLELSPPAAAGVLVANPPYGARLGEKQELAEFYPRLRDALKQRYAGWRCHIFSADKDLPKRIGLRSSARIALFNGPLECRLYEYRMVAGSTKT